MKNERKRENRVDFTTILPTFLYYSFPVLVSVRNTFGLELFVKRCFIQ